MGNLLGMEEKVEVEQYFTEAEIHELSSFYSALQVKQNDITLSVQSIFRTPNCPHFTNQLLKKEIFNSFDSFREFIRNAAKVSSIRTLETFWIILFDSNREVLLNEISILLSLIADFSFADLEEADVNRFAQMMIHSFERYLRNSNLNTTTISLSTFESWIQQYSPFLPKVLETYVNHAIFKHSLPSSYRGFAAPHLEKHSSIASEFDLLPLALCDQSLQHSWKLLYTTETDGISFNRLAHHILGYDGPTCILIKVAGGGQVIGLFSGARWKESNRFHGSASNFLFSLSPDLVICRSNPNGNRSYQWLNQKSYGHPHGMGFGGTIEQFRLFIPDSLEGCCVVPMCPTYEAGKILPTNDMEQSPFEIENLEVWAVGGKELVERGLRAQKEHRDVTKDAIRKARTCDKAAFFNSEFDQEMFLSKNFEHRRQQETRADACDFLDTSASISEEASIGVSSPPSSSPPSSSAFSSSAITRAAGPEKEEAK